MFFGYVGAISPVYYISSHAIDTQVITVCLAFYLLPIPNAASVLGRIITGFLANTTGPVNLLIPTALTISTIALCWIGFHDTGGLIIFAIFYNFFSGGFVSLPSVALTSLRPDLSRLGTRMEVCSVICSLGSLCGTPISGAVVDGTGGWVGVALFSGSTLFATGVLFLFIRWAQAETQLRMKV